MSIHASLRWIMLGILASDSEKNVATNNWARNKIYKSNTEFNYYLWFMKVGYSTFNVVYRFYGSKKRLINKKRAYTAGGPIHPFNKILLLLKCKDRVTIYTSTEIASSRTYNITFTQYQCNLKSFIAIYPTKQRSLKKKSEITLNKTVD